VSAGQWLAFALIAAWRYDARGFYVEPKTPSEDELETRLWCYAHGLDPDRWQEWCTSENAL
jgi:hypothetical protein